MNRVIEVFKQALVITTLLDKRNKENMPRYAVEYGVYEMRIKLYIVMIFV